VYLIAISGAQPVHKGLSRNHHRERRQDKSVSASSTRSGRPCNHISRHTSSSDVSLCYKNGWFLAVHDDGNINGTSDARSLDSKSTCHALVVLSLYWYLFVLAVKWQKIFLFWVLLQYKTLNPGFMTKICLFVHVNTLWWDNWPPISIRFNTGNKLRQLYFLHFVAFPLLYLKKLCNCLHLLIAMSIIIACS